MIRWTETKHTYRLVVDNRGLVLSLLLALPFNIVFGARALHSYFRPTIGERSLVELWLGASMLILNLPIAFGAWKAFKSHWIEVPVRGGPVRFGEWGSEGESEAAPIRGFRVETVPKGRGKVHQVVADLEDGRSAILLPGGCATELGEAARIASQLNAYSSAPEAETRSAPLEEKASGISSLYVMNASRGLLVVAIVLLFLPRSLQPSFTVIWVLMGAAMVGTTVALALRRTNRA